MTSDSTDAKLVMAELTVHESMLRFCGAFICCIEDAYLRAPMDEGMARTLRQSKARGFPACWVRLTALSGD